ncbi:flagellar basal body protein [Bdellovibrio sp. HCB337]|uniref:flagellar basal body protein n=1 Tax=Bdellovibrio sp. HCB337 TaxID=3394358 RepID=UPI0039A6F78A
MRFILFASLILVSSLSLASAKISDACEIKKNTRNEMNVIASNLANVNTTRTPDGGPYRRQEWVCKGQNCDVVLHDDTIIKYLPGHPDANQDGYVLFPYINLVTEMKAMLRASIAHDEAQIACP